MIVSIYELFMKLWFSIGSSCLTDNRVWVVPIEVVPSPYRSPLTSLITHLPRTRRPFLAIDSWLTSSPIDTCACMVALIDAGWQFVRQFECLRWQAQSQRFWQCVVWIGIDDRLCPCFRCDLVNDSNAKSNHWPTTESIFWLISWKESVRIVLDA